MIKVLEQMVEALERASKIMVADAQQFQDNAIQAGKKAIAELESQEPVQAKTVHITWNADGIRTVNGVPDYTPPAQPEQPALVQEPVAWLYESPMRDGSEDFLRCPSVILGKRKRHCVSTQPSKK